ncbi:MAG: glycosyltransferase family 4 protein, partial [Bacteroidales bacterium]
KAIITFHEVWWKLWFRLPFLYIPSRLIFWIYEQCIIRLPFHKFIAVSDFTKQALLHYIDENKVIKIYNGLDYSKLPIKQDYEQPSVYKFIYFGRIGVSKGLDLIIKSFGKILKKYHNVQLTLVIPQVPVYFYWQILKLLKKNAILDKVTLLHNLSREALQSEVLNSYSVLSPSYSEGFCYSIVEAIGMGVPVISSGKGALKEVVCGKFIEMKSQTVQGLTDAVEEAISGKWIETPVKKFELSEQIQEYIKLYKTLI